AAGDLFSFFIAVKIKQRSEPIVGILIHPKFTLPLGLQEIVDRFRRLSAANLLGIKKINQQGSPDSVKVAFLVIESGAQSSPVRGIVTYDCVGFFERIKRGAPNIQGIIVVFARAVLRQNTIQQALRA